MTSAVTYDEVVTAAGRIAGVAVRTPLLRSDALDAATGARIFLKPENLQRTGSFKFRGAYNRISRLTNEERTRGVVAYSSGNHAQGVAAAAKGVGAPAAIVMPSDSPAVKVEGVRAFGGEVRQDLLDLLRWRGAHMASRTGAAAPRATWSGLSGASGGTPRVRRAPPVTWAKIGAATSPP